MMLVTDDFYRDYFAITVMAKRLAGMQMTAAVTCGGGRGSPCYPANQPLYNKESDKIPALCT